MAGKLSELLALTTPAANDLIEVLDVSDTSMAATGTNKKLLLSTLGAPSDVIVQEDEWHFSSYSAGVPTGTAWPLIHRAYLTPFFTPRPIKISDIGMNVTTAGAAGTVLRIGVFAADPTTGLPGAVLVQGTVPNDTLGGKTLTLGTPVSVEKTYWIASCPQGSGAPGSTHMYGSSSPYRRMPLWLTGGGWTNYITMVVYYCDGVTGAYVDGLPGITSDQGSSRLPQVQVKYVA